MRDADIEFKTQSLVDALNGYNFDHEFFNREPRETLRCFIVFMAKSIDLMNSPSHKSLKATLVDSTDPYLRDLDQIIMWLTSGKDVSQQKEEIGNYFRRYGARHVMAMERYSDLVLFAFGDFTLSSIAFKLELGMQVAELKGFNSFDFSPQNYANFHLSIEK